MAQKPDGKPARVERVTFTRPAADRIAKVVREVEQGDRGAEPLTFRRFGGTPVPSVKHCRWTADWAIDSTATITLMAATHVTATATNVFLGAGPGSGWIARDGTAGWKLISVNLTTQPGYNGSEIQLFGHGTSSAVMQWYSISTCGTATCTP